ncbi:hypothetical protein PINS_up008254 [Pythium insidiosum]|nr:hypothetical protein PINS_up008254 [Pythium insidiosum]
MEPVSLEFPSSTSRNLATDAMFRRSRKNLERDGDAEGGGVQRNELGLVTRVRQRLSKSRQSDAATRPMFATVCVNNVNRSMNAHEALQQAGMRVCSFGAGSVVCFPGRTPRNPRVFSFSTTYKTMYETLKAEDVEHHTRTGVLKMLERNMGIKSCPQRWHKLSNKQLEDIDVVICLDSDMFITVLDDLRMRIRLCFQKTRLHVICLDTQDSVDGARSGSDLTVDLCRELEKLPELTDDLVKDTVVRFEKTRAKQLIYVGLRV